jgi:7,8-dihydropterin-6-yl-methyl-4-(beta-D-ribofuranosyl)aminobenzene 5'-phosphate synthase
VRITVLCDHIAAVPKLKTEWGASIHIGWHNLAILFDMGASGAFADNAAALGLSLDRVEFAVLSHAHRDHGGGLARFVTENSSAPVWAHRTIAADLRLNLAVVKKRVGLDPQVIARCHDRFHFVDHDAEIVPGVHIVSRIPHTLALPRGNRLLLRREGEHLIHDDFRHELVLVIHDVDGMVVLTGCGHHGVLNIIGAVRQVFPDRPIKALVGGFHFVGIPIFGLWGDGPSAIRNVAERLKEAGIPHILTMHCTGGRGYSILREALGSTVSYLGAGAAIDV